MKAQFIHRSAFKLPYADDWGQMDYIFSKGKKSVATLFMFKNASHSRGSGYGVRKILDLFVLEFETILTESDKGVTQ